MKTLDTLASDIDQLFFEGKAVDDNNLDTFLWNIGNLLVDRLKPRPEQAPTLRMSKLGTPNRKLWFEHNMPLARTQSKHALKFIYGDIVEQLILFLAKEAGHTVEEEQQEVEIDGIVGHKDCKLDGVTVDVKSASSFAFRKFRDGSLLTDDPFGYIAQLSAYAHADNSNEAAFVAVNKENGEIGILPISAIDMVNVPGRISEVKEVVAAKTPPIDKCYSPVPYQKSGNMTLHKNCTYCSYKDHCWSDANGGMGLRYFEYASGPVALTSVSNTPRVQEIVKQDASGELDLAEMEKE